MSSAANYFIRLCCSWRQFEKIKNNKNELILKLFRSSTTVGFFTLP